MNEGIQEKSRLVGMVFTVTALALVAMPTPVEAGKHYEDPGVSIFLNADGSGRAMGTIGGTRNSANVVERISCFVARQETVSGGTTRRTTSVTCAARDTTRRSITCTSTSATVALGLNGVMSDGLLEFVWDKTGKCTNIIAYESSSTERKAP
jgi:hypothetical protein